jgi:hypothetical protein
MSKYVTNDIIKDIINVFSSPNKVIYLYSAFNTSKTAKRPEVNPIKESLS